MVLAIKQNLTSCQMITMMRNNPMKKVLSVLVLASTFAVTTYAGNSESFGNNNVNDYTSGNYVTCVVQDKMITGVKGKSCLYMKDVINVKIDCPVAGVMNFDADIGSMSVEKAEVRSDSITPSIQLNDYKLSCPA